MSESTTAPSIHITDAAVRAAFDTMAGDGLSAETTYLRVGVKAGGCSGFSYQLEFTQDRREQDAVIERGGVRLLVDPKSESFLKGTELDWSGGLNGKGFVFTNPNATGTCGCGESFSV